MTTFLNISTVAEDFESRQSEPGAADSATEPQADDSLRAARDFLKRRFNLEEKDLEQRIQQWRTDLKPKGYMQGWMVEDIALASIRIEQHRKEADDWRLRQACRSPLGWQIDRRAAAAELVQGLPKRPEVITARLKQSLYGCERLIQRFESLVARVRGNSTDGPLQALDEEGRKLALDALGVPLADRKGPTRLDPPSGEAGYVAAHQAALLDDQIAQLRRLAAADLEHRDEVDRRVSEAGRTPTALDPTLRSIRRDEAASRRHMKAALEILEKAKKVDQRLQPEARPVRGSTLSEQTRQRIDSYIPIPKPPPDPTPPPTTKVPEPKPEPVPAPEPAAAPEQPRPVAAVIPAPSVPLARSADYAVAEPTAPAIGRITLASALAPPRSHPPIVNPHRDGKKPRS